MKKNKKIFIVLIICICLIGIGIVGFKIIKDRGGVVISSKTNYLVNDQLKSYRQDDSQWKDDKLGKSKFTMETSGCIVTSIATAISQSDNPLNPGQLVELLSENEVFDSDGNLQWGKLEEISGFHTKVYDDVSEEYINECLEKHRYPIVKVHRKTLTSYHHFVLIIGSENGDFICMDPLEDDLTKLSDYGNKVYAVRCVWYENN